MKSLQLMLFLLLCSSLQGQIKPEYSKEIKFKATSFPTAQYELEDRNIIIAAGAMAINSKVGWVEIPKDGKPFLKNIKDPYKKANGGHPFIAGDHMYRLYYVKNKKDKTYDEKLLKYDMDRNQIDETTLKKWKISRKQEIPYQSLTSSRDNKLVRCIGVSDQDHSKSDFRLNLKVFDESMETLTDFDYSPKGDKGQKSYQFINSKMTNDGTTYLLIKKYGEGAEESIKVSRKERVANYSYEIVKVSKGGDYETYDLDNEGRFSLNACLYLSEDNVPYVASMRSEKQFLDAHASGIDVYRLNESTGVFDYNSMDFTKSQMEKMGINIDQQKEFPKFTVLTTQSANTSNGLMLYAEETIAKRDRRGHVVTQTFVQARGFVINVSQDLEIDVKCLPKYYETGGNYGTAYFCSYQGNPYVLYAETLKNFKIDGNNYKKYTKFKNLMGDEVALGLFYLENGEWKREMIEGTEGVVLFPRTSLVTDDGILKVAIVGGGKTLKIGSIKNLEINLNKINVASK